MNHVFLPCPLGVEELLRDELHALGIPAAQASAAGARFEGTLEQAYQACLGSRIASRVLWQLASFDCHCNHDLYQGIYALDWPTHFSTQTTFAVFANIRRGYTDHSGFVAQKTKDAIVDRFRQVSGVRPDVDKDCPDIRIVLYLDRGIASLYLDLAGTPLHQRGYRQRAGVAPIKENLAAAMLARLGWPNMAGVTRIIDPMCGSGTLLIEAALMATDRAPGLGRTFWGFHAWKQHDRLCWAALVDAARVRASRGLAACKLSFLGCDTHPRMIEQTRIGFARAFDGAADEHLDTQRVALAQQTLSLSKTDLLFTNPPYGERLEDQQSAYRLYGQLGDWLKRDGMGARIAVITPDEEAGRALGLRPQRRNKFLNGRIAVELFVTEVEPAQFRPSIYSSAAVEVRPAAEPLLNRLRKNEKKLRHWLKREQVQCYRLYDADLPEYAVAIDCYGAQFHVQEYAPPADIPAAIAQARVNDVIGVLRHIYAIDLDQISVKQRRRQRGEEQYQPQERKSTSRMKAFTVVESGLNFEVDLGTYLDTGLFLDHRPVRRKIRELAAGRRFLNLFAYTGSATVYAASGGALETTTVDMSNTYLAWAERNMALNDFVGAQHHYVARDCLQWLEDYDVAEQGQFELIFCDPPTFSNSKRMDTTWDVQRDHGLLISRLMQLLSDSGVLIFSNNFKRFKLDQRLEQRFDIEDLSARTLDPDFSRNSRIHHCFEIRHTA